MDRFFDMESPPCEHVLVKTIKLTHKCEKCRQFKWPWSKAVGCIKCMNIWHRRCRSFEREVSVVKPCTVQPTAVVNIEKDNAIVGMAKAVKKFLKHPCQRIRSKVNRIRTAGVAQQLSGRPLLATLSDSCPTVTRPAESSEAEDVGSTRAITLDAQPSPVCPTTLSEAENVGSARAITLDAQSLTNFLTVVSEPNNAVSARVTTLGVRPATPNSISHSFKWPKQITIFQYLERYVAQRSSQLATKRVKWPRSKTAMFFAPAILYKNMVQVNVITENIECTVVTAYSTIGTFSYHRHIHQSYHKLTITWTATGGEELYRQLLQAVTVDSWPLPIVYQNTIRPTITTTTASTNISKAPLAITWKSLVVQDKNVVHVDVMTEKIENSVVTADPIKGKFSYQRHFRQSYPKLAITWTATGAEQLYRQLLPVVTVDNWPLPIVLQKTIRPKIITTTATVGATLMNLLKKPLAITRKSLTETPSTTITVKLAITAAPLNTNTAPPAIITSSPAITTAPPVITIASPTIAAAPLNIIAVLPAITAASSTITTASPAITDVPTASQNNSMCRRPNCKNRRCRRRQIIAATRATNNNS